MMKFILSLVLFAAQLCGPAYAVERTISADVIEGQDTVKNLLGSKGHFEKNANGVSGFDDTSSATPVDLTGGSPAVVTCARTTSAPLSGVGSLLLTHTAADGRGEGCALAFTIDTKMKYSVLQVQFDYAIPSGTYADDELDVWIYDVTNAALIQPAPYHIKNHGIASGQSMALEFQATSGTSYRIGFYSSSSNTTAYTMSIDDIKISKSAKLYGSPVTDWVSYTPVITGLGTVTGASVKSRRVGDSLEVTGSWTNGTVTAAEVTMTLGFGGVSGNVTIDINKVSLLNVIGILTTQKASTTIFGAYATAPLAGATNYVVFNQQNSTTNPVQAAGTNGDVLSANSAVTTVNFKVPITGWSSSVIMSNDANVSVIASSVYKNGTQALTSGDQKITSFTVDRDATGVWDATNSRWLIRTPGSYRFSAATLAGAFVNPSIKVNGTTQYYGASDASTSVRNMASVMIPELVAGDYVEMFGWVGGSVTLSAGRGSTYFTVEKINGPAQIAASETVAARYYGCTATITGSFSDVTWLTKENDSNGILTTTTVTIPISGRYKFSGQLYVGGTNALNGTINTQLYKNGATTVAQTELRNGGAITTAQTVPFIYDDIQAIAGDTFKIQVASSATSPVISASNVMNFIQVRRVGAY